MLPRSHSTGAGRVRPVSDNAHGVVHLPLRAICARLQQYIAFQRLLLQRAVSRRIVVPICL
ncbi:hypothetical protein [Xanthomonas oryzae]|uniref:Uncharacterized protein n=2 Tax=Xanthomonas oryzae TaxID=347 RepID=A0A854CH27_XANOO|nr:hypothetical protein [Xanthomonas oryzae]AXQ11459.1 hypothetical protein BCR61_11835 [Xanthomonas oryzae pv. oryzae]AXQ77379.1 hypothetical protein BXU03_11655 [Xanthomonas oryzae pv. oryzae]AZK89792.1 hypothetical protein BO993_20160 [Xanthomonas oryzae pv. oryzae]OLG39632.1 hypothetical protein BXO2_01475 [Xanthomonas oryzae pv. oryzae]OLG40611.1 hypothetical protein BXO33_19730 [Xanthomonas oryzae pv. oryzae]